MTKEEKAILDAIAYAEGTLGVSNNGYDVCVDFYIINGWTEDTKIVHGGDAWYNASTNSTAAGRYQFLYGTWIGNNKVNKPMTKANQDAKGLELVNKKIGSMDKTKFATNRASFNSAMAKLGGTWSSIPVDGNRLSHYGGNTPKSGDQIYAIYKEALAKY
ncbi:MAG: hypothetical protein E6R13_09830 [Spirochaetes bacterium]|nr:MAG: hypothetical protein E6R13_09830 [Spirochaetota bacterium]